MWEGGGGARVQPRNLKIAAARRYASRNRMIRWAIMNAASSDRQRAVWLKGPRANLRLNLAGDGVRGRVYRARLEPLLSTGC